MSGANGHALNATEAIPPPGMIATGASRFSAEQIKELVAALEVPFDPSQIDPIPQFKATAKLGAFLSGLTN